MCLVGTGTPAMGDIRVMAAERISTQRTTQAQWNGQQHDGYVRVKSGDRTRKAVWVPADDWMGWSAEACAVRRSQWLLLERASHLPQLIRTSDELDAPQATLMRDLLGASRAGAGRARSRAYEHEKQQLLRRLSSQPSSWSAAEIDAWISVRIKDVRSAEVGAWRITTGSGDFVVKMSSDDHGEIAAAQVQDSLNKVLATPGLDWRSIRSVEFWHTHPTALSPLSSNDGHAFENFVRGLRAAGIGAPIAMFAITVVDGLRLAFSHAVGAAR